MRQYRTAMPLDEAMNEIEKQAGSSFDPTVVATLRRTYRDLEAKARTAPALDMRLSKPARVTAGIAPAAGLEIPAKAPQAQSTSFTHLIASARQEFQDIHELTRDLGSSLNLDGTMSVLAGRLKSIVPHDAIVIYVCKQDVLVPQFFDGIHARDFSSLEVPFGSGLSGWVAENRKPIVNGNPAVEQGREETTNFKELQSAISIPLIGARDMVGVLTLYHKQLYAFTSDHLRLLMAISSKAALTLENALEYQEAKESATIDGLTGLPNTRSLFLHLDAELSRCRRTNSTLSVLVLDLDGFKSVNDRFGHLTGNRCLTTVANGLRKACRDYDYVARMGGDEFVVVLPDMSPDAVQAKCDALGEIVVEAGKECVGEEVLGLSAGAAHFPFDGENAEALLAEADRRMYQIKRQRKTRRHGAAAFAARAAA